MIRNFGRASNKPKRLLLGIHPMPTMVTLANLLCGFGAIILAMRSYNPPKDFYNFTRDDCTYWAGILIFFAMVFDVMDGKVARWTKSSSKFGLEMDSLADMVSFGVAPAVLVKAMIDQAFVSEAPFPMLDRYVWSMLATYVCCAALRLARYNVETDTGRHRNFFFGLPSPGAAGCVASLAILIIPGSHHLPVSQFKEQLTILEQWRSILQKPVLLCLPFVMLLIAVLMVTRVHYPHVGDRLLRGRKSFMHVMVLGLSLTLVVMHHEIVLAIAFNGYMIFGLANEARYQLFPSQRPSDLSIIPDDNSGNNTSTPVDPPHQEPPAN